MTPLETALMLIGCAALLAVLGPQRKRTNTNPPPTYPRPPAPPAAAANGAQPPKDRHGHADHHEAAT